MKTEIMPGVIASESNSHKIGYTEEFATFLHQHPGIIRTAIGLADKAEQTYAPKNIKIPEAGAEYRWNPEFTRWDIVKFRSHRVTPPVAYHTIWPEGGRGVIMKAGKPQTDRMTGVEVTLLGKSSREFLNARLRIPTRKDATSYFIMSVESQSYFVKRSIRTTNSAFSEFVYTHKVKDILKGFDWLDVVDPVLGYQDKYESWFVSKWNDLENNGYYSFDSGANVLDDYGRLIPRDTQRSFSRNWKNFKGVAQKIEEVVLKSGIVLEDVFMNTFYNPKTGRYFLLDVTAKEREILNQPSDDEIERVHQLILEQFRFEKPGVVEEIDKIRADEEAKRIEKFRRKK